MYYGFERYYINYDFSILDRHGIKDACGNDIITAGKKILEDTVESDHERDLKQSGNYMEM